MTEATDQALDSHQYRCRDCQSDNVRVCLPAWHTVDHNGAMEYEDTDWEAEVLAAHCEDCGSNKLTLTAENGAVKDLITRWG